MDIREVGRLVFNVLWNVNTNNNSRETSVSIDYVVNEIQQGSSVYISRDQIVNAIENDPFRQIDAWGVVTGLPLYEVRRTNDILISVMLPQFAYENPRQWGLS